MIVANCEEYFHRLIDFLYTLCMKFDLDVNPGRYVVAVSGGVDSVVLLNLLMKLSNMATPKRLQKRYKTFQVN